MENLRVTILTDNPNSWIVPYADQLAGEYGAERAYCASSVRRGDVLVILGCEKVLPPEILARNESNVVVHPSALPAGRGFSPLAWQILEGASIVPAVLFEAVEEVDAGDVYLVEWMIFDGTELNDEIKAEQGEVTLTLVRRYLDGYPMEGRPQVSEGATWYRRRTAADSELDTTKSIRDQFNLLRVVDNDRYPAFFVHNGHRYTLRIERD